MAERETAQSAGAAGAEPPSGSAPPAGWASGPLGRAQAADREIARQTALRARALAEFAATRPASADRPQGTKGAMGAERWAARSALMREVSEWAAQETVIALSISHQAAETQLERALVLAHRLPATLDALEAGALHTGHLWPLLEHVAPIADAVVRAEIEAELLGWMAGRVTTPAQLGAKTRRLVLARNAREAGRRLAAAVKERGIHLRAERTPGMAAVTAVLTMPEAQLLYRALGAYADELPDDPADDRTRGQKMVDCLLDLVLRPGETDLPPVQVLLTVVASLGTLLGGDQPGEVDGQVVPAEMIRDLLRAVTGRTRAADDAEDQGGSTDVATVPERAGELRELGAPGTAAEPGQDFVPEPDEDPELVAWWAEVERRVLAGELPDEPDPVPDEVLRRWAEEATPDPGEGSWHTRAGLPADPLRDEVLRQWAEHGPLDHRTGPPGTADPPVAADPPWAADPPPGAGAPVPAGSRTAAAAPEPGPGWWALAEQAVSAASGALRSASDALGHARRAVHTARMADLADEARWQASPSGRVSAAADALGALDAATAAARRDLADLLDAPPGGALADRPRIALVDALSGTLLALSDLPSLRRAAACGAEACRRRPEGCTHDLAGRPGLGPPGPTDAYRPGRELDRWVRARDRRCRFPGCRRRVPRAGELDHVVRHPDGPTSAGNLAGWCTGDHRCKHQAPGWEFALAPDGTVTVTTPTGLTTTTTPPPY